MSPFRFLFLLILAAGSVFVIFFGVAFLPYNMAELRKGSSVTVRGMVDLTCTTFCAVGGSVLLVGAVWEIAYPWRPRTHWNERLRSWQIRRRRSPSIIAVVADLAGLFPSCIMPMLFAVYWKFTRDVDARHSVAWPIAFLTGGVIALIVGGLLCFFLSKAQVLIEENGNVRFEQALHPSQHSISFGKAVGFKVLPVSQVPKLEIH